MLEIENVPPIVVWIVVFALVCLVVVMGFAAYALLRPTNPWLRG